MRRLPCRSRSSIQPGGRRRGIVGESTGIIRHHSSLRPSHWILPVGPRKPSPTLSRPKLCGRQSTERDQRGHPCAAHRIWRETSPNRSPLLHARDPGAGTASLPPPGGCSSQHPLDNGAVAPAGAELGPHAGEILVGYRIKLQDFAPQSCRRHRAVRKRNRPREPQPQRGIRAHLVWRRYDGDSAAHLNAYSKFTTSPLLLGLVRRQQVVVTAEVELATRDLD